MVFLSTTSWTKSEEPKLIVDADAARRAIAGKVERTWILEAEIATLGRRCERGERYIFSSSGSLEMERCEDGAWAGTSGTWQVSGGGPAGLKIEIDGVVFDLMLREHDDEIEMVMVKLADRKDEETIERSLFYQRD